jgi:hypothetical protein
VAEEALVNLIATTSATRPEEENAHWELLLDELDNGTVIPVVGPDLLTVDIEDVSQRLHDVVAKRLGRLLGLPDSVVANESGSRLNTVATEFISSHGDWEPIYATIARIMSELGNVPVPAALLELVSIDAFSVFVTTTFDSLLANAVTAVRNRRPDVLGFSPRARPSSPEFTASDNVVIYHLFGQLSRLPRYVVTEEDALEVVFQLQEARNRSDHFVHRLSENSLLLIGCSFPSWLVRFFLRLTRGKRLILASRDRADFIVDPFATADPGLLQFLRMFRTRTFVFQQYTSQSFVSELARRWRARARTSVPTLMPLGSVFVSYASEDRSAAQTIVDTLRTYGLPAWLDVEELKAGEQWDSKIRYNIEAASAFVPVLSKVSTTVSGRYFISEWSKASEWSRRFAANDAFIFPVAIDDVTENHPSLPESFRLANWSRFVDGRISDTLADHIKSFIRRRKAGMRL